MTTVIKTLHVGMFDPDAKTGKPAELLMGNEEFLILRRTDTKAIRCVIMQGVHTWYQLGLHLEQVKLRSNGPDVTVPVEIIGWIGESGASAGQIPNRAVQSFVLTEETT